MAFPTDNHKGLEAITDGTSNTIALSESGVLPPVPKPGVWSSGREIKYAFSGAVANLATSNGIANCLATVDPNDRRLVKGTTAGTAAGQYQARRGYFLYSSYGFYTAFATVLPPNSPHCGNAGPGAWGMYSANSYHPGGVNGTFFDGSVHFISETINSVSPGLTAAPKQELNGESQYGVWGAFGSINGGESKGL
jgi:prepilin-type processing-associated H-X9-DG protein